MHAAHMLYIVVHCPHPSLYQIYFRKWNQDESHHSATQARHTALSFTPKRPKPCAATLEVSVKSKRPSILVMLRSSHPFKVPGPNVYSIYIPYIYICMVPPQKKNNILGIQHKCLVDLWGMPDIYIYINIYI